VNIGDFFLIWVHVTAAAFWVGGMMFLSLIAVPLLRRDSDPPAIRSWFISLARRFRIFVWVALLLLVITGAFLLPRVIAGSLSPLTWSPVIWLKLSLVFALTIVSLLHDRVVAPKVQNLKQKDFTEWSGGERLLVRLSPFIGRLTLFLGLAVLFAAVMVARM
jgi:copper resistance protein D